MKVLKLSVSLFLITFSLNSFAFDTLGEVSKALDFCEKTKMNLSEAEIIDGYVSSGYEGYGCEKVWFQIQDKTYKSYICGEFGTQEAREVRLWQTFKDKGIDSDIRIVSFYNGNGKTVCE